jgi:hypothetical protein
LVALAVIAIVEGVLVQGSLSRRRQCQAEERRIQAEWLADAALQRALAQLAKNSTYPGESWVIPPEQLNGRDEAKIRIDVEPAGEQRSEERIRISVDYPREGLIRARRERTWRVQRNAVRSLHETK